MDVVVVGNGDCKVGIGFRTLDLVLDCLKGGVRKLRFYLAESQEPLKSFEQTLQKSKQIQI